MIFEIYDLETVQVNTKPFKHGYSENFISEDLAKNVLNWFETEAPWHLVETDFYKQFEFSFNETNTPNTLKPLIDISNVKKLISYLSDVFSCDLKDDFTLVAHKLEVGQYIKIHNDYIDNPDFELETHRIIIQVNKCWSEDSGGYLMIFNSYNSNDVANIILPKSRSMFCFEISKESFHAVSNIHNGERYTLIYNFFSR